MAATVIQRVQSLVTLLVLFLDIMLFPENIENSYKILT